MTRTGKVFGVIVIILAVALVGLGITLSRDTPCGPLPAPPANVPLMKAIVYRCYGAPDVLKLENIEKPAPTATQVLVKVRAASVNPYDWHFMRGKPYFMRLDSGIGAPKETRFGVDYAGTVEAVGPDVTTFKPGDEVFGARTGAFAEYVIVREERMVVPKPGNVSFEQAASIGIAGTTALQALRDRGKLQAGQRVLINGASGGVGTFAVQIAKAMGAEVTGVCSTRNVDMVRSLGADRVIDYTKEDYTQGGEQYDLIVDMVGSRSLLDNKRVLKPDGIFVIVGGPKGGDFLGPMTTVIKASLMSPFVSQDMGMMLADSSKQDLAFIADLIHTGKVTPVIDRHYPLSEAAAAVAYVEEGHARGKVIIDVEQPLQRHLLDE
jgi:NADPH:quinone reductase-like Zn-dependent oxidoreductase